MRTNKYTLTHRHEIFQKMAVAFFYERMLRKTPAGPRWARRRSRLSRCLKLINDGIFGVQFN